MKTIIITIIILITVAFLAISCAVYTNYRLNKSYQAIQIGDSADRVRSIMGKPGKVLTITDRDFSSQNISSCAQEYIYDAIILPERWLIGLDNNGKVIHKNHNIM